MPRARAVVLFAAFSCLRVFAQSSTDPEQTAVPTIRTNTNLVILDVVVTGKDQEPVLNLKANDFRVMENGTPQVIRSFEEHTGADPYVAAPAAPLPAGVFTNDGLPSNISTLNILMLDSLNAPIPVQMYARQQMLEYLKTAKPSGPIAIFVLGTELKLIQGFTSDMERVTATLTHYVPEVSLLNSGGIGGPSRNGKILEAAGSSGPAGDRVVSSMNQDKGIGPAGLLRAPYTLNALNALARYLAGIPGRKNLIWFAGRIPINLSPYGVLRARYNAMYDDELRATVDLLARSRVSLYPIRAAGLTLTSSPVPDPAMLELATQTGGRVLPITNDLADATARSILHGSHYYAISYAPGPALFDGEYRRIKVGVEHAGLQVDYRRGYYAFSDNRTGPAGSKYDAAAPPDSTTYSAMHMALLPGTPLPSQILFRARVLPATEDTEKNLATGNVARNKLKGPFRTYAVDVKADPRGMMFVQGSDGSLHDSLEFICFVYDSEGKLINTATGDVNARIKESVEQFAARGGLALHQQISVPVKGDYTLRVALHDMQGDRVGAVEVPISSVKRLAPAVASAAIP